VVFATSFREASDFYSKQKMGDFLKEDDVCISEKMAWKFAKHWATRDSGYASKELIGPVLPLIHWGMLPHEVIEQEIRSCVFSTSALQSARTNPQGGLRDNDLVRVLNLKNSVHTIDLLSWYADVPLKRWEGVTCENRRVTEICLCL
jgi:hypothetical protein